jgi:hypothetical protein
LAVVFAVLLSGISAYVLNACRDLVNRRSPLLSVLLLCGTLAASTLILPNAVSAQSAQKYGLQGSVFTTGIPVNDGTLGGVGAEAQFRFNQLKDIKATGGPLSLGIGGQYTSHKSKDDLTLKVSGLFIEPRVVIDKSSAEHFFPYLSARVGLLRQSSDFASTTNGFAVGVGLGFGYKLNANVNLDVGAAALQQSFSDASTSTGGAFRFGSLISYVAKVGLNFGFP